MTSIRAISSAGAITAAKSMMTDTTAWPWSHMTRTPPSTVVLASRPAAESPSIGTAFATRKATAAATVRARVRFRESGRLDATTFPQRGQRADSPGARIGSRCTRSQSEHAISVAETMLNPIP